jgi:hypothetical protein
MIRRHRKLLAVGTTWSVGTRPGTWTRGITSWWRGNGVELCRRPTLSDLYRRPSRQHICFFLFLFVYLYSFIYQVYLCGYFLFTNCTHAYPSEKLRKCYRMRVHIISEGGMWHLGGWECPQNLCVSTCCVHKCVGVLLDPMLKPRVCSTTRMHIRWRRLRVHILD